jgi:hypothetical protein
MRYGPYRRYSGVLVLRHLTVRGRASMNGLAGSSPHTTGRGFQLLRGASLKPDPAHPLPSKPLSDSAVGVPVSIPTTTALTSCLAPGPFHPPFRHPTGALQPIPSLLPPLSLVSSTCTPYSCSIQPLIHHSKSVSHTHTTHTRTPHTHTPTHCPLSPSSLLSQLRSHAFFAEPFSEGFLFLFRRHLHRRRSPPSAV